MKGLIFSMVLMVLLALGCAVPAKHRVSETNSKSFLQKEKEVDEQSDVECRWIVPTGSHLRKRVCKSRFEWEMERQSGQDFLQRPRAGDQIGK